MNNYMVLNIADGVYTYTFSAEKRADCVACSNSTKMMVLESDATLQTIYDKLCEDQLFMMKSPGMSMKSRSCSLVTDIEHSPFINL